MQSQLTIRDLSLRYDSGVQIGPLSLELMPGEVTLIAGASGAGKSTLARLCGYPRTNAGHPPPRRRHARARHSPRANSSSKIRSKLSTRPVASDLLLRLPAQLSRSIRRRSSAGERALTKTLELEPWTTMSQRFPHQLSGGQRQRVLLARALAARPQLSSADEPTAMLDQSLKQGVYSLLRNLAKEFGVGVIMITHDLLGAEPFADRIIVMDSGSVVDDFPQNQTSIKLSPVALTLVQAALFRSPRAGEQNDIQ